MIRNNRLSFILVFLLALITVGVVLFCQYPNITDRLVAHCDVNLYIFPVYKLLTPSLFSGDFLTGYMLCQTPKGYLALFYLLGHLFDPLLIATFAPFILCLISAGYLFLIGKKIKGDGAGFISAVLFVLHSWTFHTFQGFTPRAFIYPLLLPFIYCLIGKKYRICLILFILQLFFYPPGALICLVLFLISTISVKAGKIKSESPFSLTALFFLFLCVAYLIHEGINTSRIYGPAVSWAEMLAMPEFHPGGKEDFFIFDPLMFLKSPRAGLHLNNSLIFIGGAFFALLFIVKIIMKKDLRLPPEITRLIYASLLLYLLSFVFLLRLYYPARYIMFSLPIFLCLSIGIMFSDVLYKIRNNLGKVLFLSLFFAPLFLFYKTQINGRLVDYRYLRGVLEHVNKLPEDSLIASTIFISDPIPTFTKRSVLFSHRLLIPFQKRYYAALKRRVYDFYDAYYADSEDRLKEFCSRYPVDYIIVDKHHFRDGYFGKNTEFDEPFNSYLLYLGRQRSNFILPGIDRSRIVFEDGRFLIIKTAGLK